MEFDEEAYCDECLAKGAYKVGDRCLCEICKDLDSTFTEEVEILYGE